MKVNIPIEKAVLKVWEKEVIVSIKNAKACKLTYNTLKKAVQTGECSQLTHDKINAFLLKQRVKIKELVG